MIFSKNRVKFVGLFDNGIGAAKVIDGLGFSYFPTFPYTILIFWPKLDDPFRDKTDRKVQQKVDLIPNPGKFETLFWDVSCFFTSVVIFQWKAKVNISNISFIPLYYIQICFQP